MNVFLSGHYQEITAFEEVRLGSLGDLKLSIGLVDNTIRQESRSLFGMDI